MAVAVAVVAVDMTAEVVLCTENDFCCDIEYFVDYKGR